MEEEINPQQNPGQAFQELKEEGLIHPVVAVLRAHKEEIMGLINSVSVDPGADPESKIRASDEYLNVAQAVINSGSFTLGEADVVEIGRYLHTNFASTDLNNQAILSAFINFRKNLVYAVGVVYSMGDIPGKNNERLISYVQMSPAEIVKSEGIAGNREVLERIEKKAKPVVDMIERWDRKDIKKRYRVPQGFFTIEGDFGNRFNIFSNLVTLAKRMLPPVAPNQTASK